MNNNTKAVFVVLLTCLGVVSAYLTMKASDKFGAYVSSGIPVAILLVFQLHFYFLGKKWEYMGGNGLAELKYSTWLRISTVCKKTD